MKPKKKIVKQIKFFYQKMSIFVKPFLLTFSLDYFESIFYK